MKESIERIKRSLPQHVRLVAVSKTRSREEINEAIQYGIHDFAENRIQELLSKIDENDDIHWHMIGHLQTNKVKYAVQHCSLIHSVDSLNLLDEIQRHAAALNKTMPILLQINLAREDTKSGFILEDMDEALKYASQLTNIHVQGFMVIGPHSEDERLIHQVFAQAQELFKHYEHMYQLSILSMGMSQDYHIAVLHGSTMVRVGCDIFGNRK